MDLGNTPSPMERYDGCSVGEVLDGIEASLRRQRDAKLDEWAGIVAWADANVVDAPEDAATIWDGIVDTAVPIAGPGAPLVSEFKLMELIAVLGRSHDSGRLYVGRILEVTWRLPEVFTAVIEGRCEVWRALRLADLTLGLPEEATDFIDRQLGPVVSTCTWAQIERLVAEAAPVVEVRGAPAPSLETPGPGGPTPVVEVRGAPAPSLETSGPSER
ncbi:MAG TPA: hypothetical protein VNS55_15465 [Nocardioides sp.]|nr:hypothetical protein [Nocardioides sp.]